MGTQIIKEPPSIRQGAFIFALGIMYIPMNEGLHLPEIEKAPFLGLSCYLIVIDISNGSL